MKTQEQKRRYFLHKKLKPFMVIYARKRTISHHADFTISEPNISHYRELVDVYEYKIQYALL